MNKVFDLKRLGYLVIILSLALFLTNCGSSGGGDSLQPPQTNISGTWTIEEGPATSNSQCNDNTHYFWTASIVHDGTSNSFTLTPTGGDTYDVGTVYTGSISGSNLWYSGSAYDPECDSLSMSVALTLNAAGNVATGSANWTCTWTGGGCSGSTVLVATR